MIIYNFLRVCLKAFYKLFYFAAASGTENIPEGNGMLIVSNHISMGDPIIVGIYFRRKIYFMAKKELWNHKLIGGVLGWLGAFPVDRDGADLGAVKTALRLLKEGKNLAMFPEGTRNHNGGRIESMHSGCAAIALRSNVPIVPVAITGRHRLFGRTHLSIGTPIDAAEYRKIPDRKEAEAQLAERIKTDINALWDNEIKKFK